MHTEFVHLDKLIKQLDKKPNGNLLHGILLEDKRNQPAKVEGHGVNQVMSINQFNQKVEGQANTVATKEGKIHFVRITNIGDGEDIAGKYEIGDIVQIAPELKSNFMPVSPTECIISDTIVLTIYRKSFDTED